MHPLIAVLEECYRHLAGPVLARGAVLRLPISAGPLGQLGVRHLALPGHAQQHMRKRALAWLLVVVRRHAYPRRVGLATGSAAAARAVTIDSGAAVQLGFSTHAAGHAGAAEVEFGTGSCIQCMA